MFKSLITLVLSVAALFIVANAQLTIDTPTTGVVTCQPLLITWSGGEAPYFLSLLPGGQPSATPLVDFGRQNGTSLTWIVNQPAGTSLGLTIRDNSGRTAATAPFTVTGTDTSCLNSTSLVTSAGTATTRAGATTGAAPGVTTTPASGNTGTTRPATTGASGAASASSPAATSAADQLWVNSAFLGAIGAAILALLA